MKLKTIKLEDKYFTCDGRKFYISDSCSFARFREFQKLALEFGYSSNFITIFKNLREAWDHLNNSKQADAAVVIHNIMKGITSLDDKDDPSMRICALFINEENEDVTRYEEGMMKEKIDCWAKELDVAPFFQLAASLVTGWTSAYKNVTQSGFKLEKSETLIS
jgi:hypothetical protein